MGCDDMSSILLGRCLRFACLRLPLYRSISTLANVPNLCMQLFRLLRRRHTSLLLSVDNKKTSIRKELVAVQKGEAARHQEAASKCLESWHFEPRTQLAKRQLLLYRWFCAVTACSLPDVILYTVYCIHHWPYRWLLSCTGLFFSVSPPPYFSCFLTFWVGLLFFCVLFFWIVLFLLFFWWFYFFGIFQYLLCCRLHKASIFWPVLSDEQWATDDNFPY